MRLGLLSPAEGNLDDLRQGADFLLKSKKAHRVIYLGADECFDEMIEAWGSELVHGDASDRAIWTRSLDACVSASPGEIDAYLEHENQRSALRVFESLVGDATRSVEMITGKLAVMIYDKAHFDEEDMLPATLLVFGKSPNYVVKQVGHRWFLCPGPFSEAGVMLLESTEQGLAMSIYTKDGDEVSRQILQTTQNTKFNIQSAD